MRRSVAAAEHRLRGGLERARAGAALRGHLRQPGELRRGEGGAVSYTHLPLPTSDLV